MKLLTEEAILKCDHGGKVSPRQSQDWVTIGGRRVLVDDDPERVSISTCPNTGPTIKPCLNTLTVKEGYSEWIRIDRHAVCLDSLNGLTDGTPPGIIPYRVRDPGQNFVSQKP